MEKIKNLNCYQKGMLIVMIVMILIFSVIYPLTISRVGLEYQGAILVPGQKDGSTVYSGKLKGKPAQFTVSEDKTVVFQYGDNLFGPYTAKEDPTAIPEDEERAEDMIGVELRKGDSLMFRGGVLCLEDSYWLFQEDGTLDLDSFGVFYYGTEKGTKIGELGQNRDSVEPAVTDLFRVMGNPKLTHKGQWSSWFGAVFVCILNTIFMLFAEELFRWQLTFQIRNVDHVEPSDWEIAGRYICWTVLTMMALVLFITGLQ